LYIPSAFSCKNTHIQNRTLLSDVMDFCKHEFSVLKISIHIGKYKKV